MFNLLNVALCGVEWKVGPDNWELWTPLAFVLAILLGGIIVYFAKRDMIAKYAKGSYILFAVVTIAVLIAKLSIEIGGQEEIEKFQMFFIIGSIMLILAGLVFVLANIFVKDNAQVKKVCNMLAVALIIVAIGLFIAGAVQVTVDHDGWIPGSEEFMKLDVNAQNTITAFTFIALIAMIAFTLIPDKSANRKNDTLAVVYGGVTIAMSFALSYARIFKMPAGGSVTVASLLPLVLYAYMFGTKKGVMAGMIYGVLQIMQDPWIVHPAQVLLDYVLAFGCIGFSGLFRNIKIKPLAIGLGATFGALLRFFCSFISGGLFFYQYMPEEFLTKYSPWAWSALYNSVFFVDIAIVVVVGVLLMLNKQFVKLTTDVTNRYLNA